MKTSELTGAQLDWAVCEASGFFAGYTQFRSGRAFLKVYGVARNSHLHPSTNWAQGGPIIEREGITVLRCDDDYGTDAKGFCNNQRIPKWAATTGQHGSSETYGSQGDNYGENYEVAGDSVTGQTPLIAAMRCFVSSKLGDTIDIPKELA